MTVSAAEVKKLRDQTGAGIMDCKAALKENDGDLGAAQEYLRKQGLEEAQSKTAQAAEGTVGSYLHFNGKIGVIVEINSQTDFVAKTEKFADLANEIAMQIAAQAPEYVSRDEVPADILEKEREIIAEQMSDQLTGKPEPVREQILSGKLAKNLYQKKVLLDQPYIGESGKTVRELIEEHIADFDENIVVRRFVRFEVGEGIEVEEEDFAAEVAREIG